MKQKNLIKLITSNSGQTIAEYAILMGLVAIVCLIIVSGFLKVGYGTAFNKYAGLLSDWYTYN